MWRISLIDPKTEKVYSLGYDYKMGLQERHTATSAPTCFSEGFNFMGVLNGKKADDTMLAIEQWVARWQHCKPYNDDKFAPTMGNIRVVMESLLNFGHQFPNGLWKVEA